MPNARLVLNLTKAAIENIPPASAGRRNYYNDVKVQGLQLVVTDSGSKSYYLYVRNAGKPVRHHLGGHPALTPENARRLAEIARGQAATGTDLRAARRKQDRDRVTLKDAFDAFKVARASLKPHTLYEYGRYVEVAFKEWRDRPLKEITKDGVAKRHQRLTTDHGPAYADGAMRSLRSIINFAQFHYEGPDGSPPLSDNPVRRLSQTRAWHRRKRRLTYVKTSQLVDWFEAVRNLKADPDDKESIAVSDWLQLMMLAGLRRSEALGLPWSDVDLKERTLTVRDTKNHEDHTLPLSDYLLDLLAKRREVNPEAIFVFASYGDQGHLIDPRKALELVIAKSGIPFTPHDLRRTFITVAESIDISAYALKRLLNHKMRQDVTAGYIITDVERLRKPMQQITDFILRSAALKPTASVESITKERAL